MSNFFEHFPKIAYDMNKDGNPFTSTNIMLRFKMREVVIKHSQLMFEYIVKDGEKPFVVAHKYYGRSELSELILLANTIVDPYFQWPLGSNEFADFIRNKYGSIQYATQNVHSYWQILQERTYLYDGTIVPERTIRVDRTTYLALPASGRKVVYLYDYEDELNESRRRISLLKKEYIPQIEEELKTIFTKA